MDYLLKRLLFQGRNIDEIKLTYTPQALRIYGTRTLNGINSNQGQEITVIGTEVIKKTGKLFNYQIENVYTSVTRSGRTFIYIAHVLMLASIKMEDDILLTYPIITYADGVLVSTNQNADTGKVVQYSRNLIVKNYTAIRLTGAAATATTLTFQFTRFRLVENR
jgi:hypothetical protein